MFDLITGFFTSGDLPIEYLAIGAMLALVLAVAQMAKFETVHLVLGGLFFFSSVAVSYGNDFRPITQWIGPLQTQRSAFFLISGAMLYLTILAHNGRLFGRPWPAQALLMLVIACYAGVIRVVHEGPGQGVASIVFATATIFPATIVLAGMVDSWRDILKLIRMMAWTNAVWVGIVVIQFFINPSQLSKGNQGRFMGLLGNPQHAAVYLGLMAAIVLWLYLSDPDRRKRLVWLVLLGLDVILLLWTASRTGMGILVVGAAVAFYGRLGKTILLAPIAVVLVLVLASVAGNLGVDFSGAERLGSLEDTRSNSWSVMYSAAKESPWIGVGIDAIGKSENSYLYGFASFGVGMFILTVILVGVTAVLVLKLLGLRRRCAPEQRGLVDLAIGFNAMYFSGAVLEGYLMARVSSTLVLYLAFATISAKLIRIAREDPEWLSDPWTTASDEDIEAWELAEAEEAEDAEWDDEQAWGDEEQGTPLPA